MVAVSVGGTGRRERLFTVLHDQLHRQRELGRNTFPTMGPTALLHETHLNLARWQTEAVSDRARLLAYASPAIRCLLIDCLSICPASLGCTFSQTTTGRRK